MHTTTCATRALRIAIVTGPRPGQLHDAIAHWVLDAARERDDAHISLVDVGGQRLGLAGAGVAQVDAPRHLDAWSRTVAAFDGFVFVTPEYNEASAGLLRHAIHVVARDWRSKAAGFVGYGAQGAVRAVDDLRQALVGVGVAPVEPQVSLTLVPGFWRRSSFMPDARHAPDLHLLLDRVITWSRALRTVRVALGQDRDRTVPLATLRRGDPRFRGYDARPSGR